MSASCPLFLDECQDGVNGGGFEGGILERFFGAYSVCHAFTESISAWDGSEIARKLLFTVVAHEGASLGLRPPKRAKERFGDREMGLRYARPRGNTEGNLKPENRKLKWGEATEYGSDS